jgi:hypothetical protein
MASENGSSNAAGGGTGGSTKPSWQGGGAPSTFDPKNFGTTIMSDASKTYQQGPKINPTNPFVDYTDATKGLIQGGLDRNTAMQGNSAVTGMASGANLGNGNPFLNTALADTRANVLDSLGDEFSSFGRYGGGSMVDTAVDRIAPAENAARLGQYNQDVANMFSANTALDSSNAQALGYSGLLDSKAKEQNLASSEMWDRTNNADYNHLAKYLGLLRGGDAANETNKPVSLLDILGGIGSTVGAFL